MMNLTRDYYLGIDLGTTNSLISWSTENHKGEIVTEVLNMDMQDITGSIKSQLLPSYIYLDEKNFPVIGKKAKVMVSRQPERVIKNAKSYMGTEQVFKLGNREITPVEASAMILKYIGKAVEKQLGKYPENVVITVPASFDTDKRRATLKSAELAGFKTKDRDGKPLEVLLSEPRAALYDYVNLQNKNEIPSTIDFRTPKNIVVFDLGGGTLDVSIHRLKYNNSGDIEINDLGVSRYTEVGGSDFDKTVGNFMMKQFIEKNRIKSLDSYETNYLKDKFSEFAEEIKIELNTQMENEKFFGFGEIELNKIEAEIFKTSVLQGYNFNFKMNLAEYREVVKEILAPELKMEDLARIDEIKNCENIVYPILDAIKKAESKLGDKLAIDAVILNGGMTKFSLIEERVEKFFGMKPHSVLDQDKSVARGASVFNFRTQKGEKFEKIQNDTIGIERAGGKVHHIIEAGTVLPVTKVISDFVIPQDSIRVIDLPFYLGRREDTSNPNRKIAERRICFDKPMNRGEKVSMEIHVDEMGIMEIVGKAGKNEQKFNVVLETDGKVEKEVTVIGSIENVTNSYVERFVPTGEFIEIDRTMKEYLGYCGKADKTTYPTQKAELMKKIKSLEATLLNGRNGKHFAEALIEKYPTFLSGVKDRVTYLLGEFGKNYSELRGELQPIFLKNISLEEMIGLGAKNLSKGLLGYIRFSIEGLRKIEAKIADETLLLQLTNNNLLSAIEVSTVMSIGGLCSGEKALENILSGVELGKNEAYFWALGKFGSREKREITPIYKLEKSVLEIAKKLKKLKSREMLRNAIYSLAEICDRRGEGEKISKETAREILIELDGVTSRETAVTKILEVARLVIKGEKLTDYQNKILLDLRVFL